MFKIDLASPMLELVVEEKRLLSGKRKRLWNRSKARRNAATAAAIYEYEQSTGIELTFGEDEEENGLIKFLQWLIDHQEQIRALIEMIMELFNTDKTEEDKKKDKIIKKDDNILL